MYLYLIRKNSFTDEKLQEFFTSKSYDPRWEGLVSDIEALISSSNKNKSERVACWRLILAALSDFDGSGVIKNIPTGIFCDYFGKRHFSGSDIKFNISHSENFAAVIFSFDSEVGIDIEEDVSEEKRERIGERFLNKNDIEYALLSEGSREKKVFENAKIKLFENDGFELLKLEKHTDEFLARWTAMEAVMKCDGRGFSALPRLSAIREEMLVVASSILVGGERIHLSIAQKRG